MAGRSASLLDTDVTYVAEDGVRVDTNVRSVDLERVSRGHPVRRVHTAAGKKHYAGEFWSVTIDAHLSYESRLELDRLWLADFDDSVRCVATQPFWLRGKDGPDVRRHVPDALLQLVTGSYTVVDVKPVEFQSRPAVAAVLDWTSRVCDAKGWHYEVWGGADAVLLANIRHIGQARRPGLVPDRVLDLAYTVDPSGRPWRMVRDDLESAGVDAPNLCIKSMLWRKAWVTDMRSRPLCSDSTLWLAGDTQRDQRSMLDFLIVTVEAARIPNDETRHKY
jgi:hypothetical protein